MLCSQPTASSACSRASVSAATLACVLSVGAAATVVSAGDAPLRGNEHMLIQRFKATLGLDDVDAAPVHMDVGRRVLRGRLEAGTRGEDMEARKVWRRDSQLTTCGFLLPWGHG